MRELENLEAEWWAKEEKSKSGEDEQELAFSGLNDRCIEKSIGDYKYKICDLELQKVKLVSSSACAAFTKASLFP